MFLKIFQVSQGKCKYKSTKWNKASFHDVKTSFQYCGKIQYI